MRPCASLNDMIGDMAESRPLNLSSRIDRRCRYQVVESRAPDHTTYEMGQVTACRGRVKRISGISHSTRSGALPDLKTIP